MQAHQVRARALLELKSLDEAASAIEAANDIARRRNWVIAEARGYETRAFISDARGSYSNAADWHRRALDLLELVAPLTSLQL